MFDIKGKVALVTGGCSGIGFECVQELLKSGAKGVTIVDLDEQVGLEKVELLEKQFGQSKAIFIKTDVVNYDQLEAALQKTVDKFGHIDILINNAAIMNDFNWKKEVAVNVIGVINGMILGLENYLQKYKSGDESVIVNTSSVAGVSPFGFGPIYTGTKFAVHGMTLSWGLPDHYERTKVRVVGVCPGATTTPLLDEGNLVLINSSYKDVSYKELKPLPFQTVQDIAPKIMTVIQKAPSGTMWVIEGGNPPAQFVLPDRFKMDKTILN